MKKKKKGFKLPKYTNAGLYTDPNITGSNVYGRKSDNPYLQTASTSDEMSGGNSMNWGALANMGMQLGSSMGANQNLEGVDKQRANERSMNAAADQGIQMIPGFGQFYGLAKGASDTGRSMIGKDEEGLAHSAAEQSVDNFMNPTHAQITSDISKGQYGEAALSAVFNKGIGSAIGAIAPNTKFGKKMTAYGRGEKIFPMGGNFQEGGNAQLERQENTLNPDGSTTQFNLPSHEGQSPQEGTVLDPGTLIFSDRLKPRGSKLTFAELNKSNNTDKEDKILEKGNRLAKLTAQLMKDAKNKQSLKLFEAQEILKQSKISNYTKKLGGKMGMHPDGGLIPDTNYFGKDVQGFPIDKTGRRLSTEEQLGFNRPGYTYGAAKDRFYTENNSAFKAQPLSNAGGNITMGTTLPEFSYTAGQVDATGRPIPYNEAFNSYLATNYKQKNGGMIPKYWHGGPHDENETSYYNDQGISQKQMYRMNMLSGIDNTPSNWGSYSNMENSTMDNTPEFELSRPDGPNTNNFGNNTPKQSGQGMNWKDAAYQAGMWGANNLGELSYLLGEGKKYDTQKEYTYSPSLLDPTASLRDADNIARVARYDLADKSSGHSGNYLSNRSALATAMALNKDKIRREYANANAGISNSGQQYNIQNKYMVDDINARNKGKALSNYYKSIESMGSNTAQGMKDNKASKMDQKTLDMMSDMFSNYKYDSKTNSWIFKK